MIKYSVYSKDTGRAVMFGEAANMENVYINVPDGCDFLVNDQPPGLDCYRQEGAWVSIGKKPAAGWDFDWATKAWIDMRGLDQQKEAQIAAINAAFEQAAAALTAGYPESERATWATQQSEVLAWQADPATPTVYLDSVAAARGIDRLDMCAKTLENVQLFMTASAALVGRRQARRDAVYAATTPAAVAAVTWDAA